MGKKAKEIANQFDWNKVAERVLKVLLIRSPSAHAE